MKQSFWGRLQRQDRYMVGNLFFLYLIQGVFVLLIGSILPMMKADYALSYQVGGFLISAHSIGNLLTGLIAGLLPLYLGLKRSLMLLNILPFIGFAITLFTGNPWLLIFGILLTGIGRGAISNYNNQVVSTLSGGSAAPLNMLHGFFAIGAVTAPFIALLCTRRGPGGWRLAVYIIIALGLLSMVTSAFMKMDSIPYAKPTSVANSFGFLRSRSFRLSCLIIFCYLSVEASLMGWMVTYFTDSGVVSADSAQLLTMLLWVTILIGRFCCSVFAGRLAIPRLLRLLTGGIIVFLLALLLSHSLIPMLLSTIGLGLSLSGMYGTAVANAGDVFGRYPLAMGVYVTVTSIGSVITPSIIGAIAGAANIHLGMSVLLLPAVLSFLFTLINKGPISDESK